MNIFLYFSNLKNFKIGLDYYIVIYIFFCLITKSFYFYIRVYLVAIFFSFFNFFRYQILVIIILVILIIQKLKNS